MTRRVYVGMALGILTFAVFALAAEEPQPDYWGQIRSLLEATGTAEGAAEKDAARDAGWAYIASLSPQQMIVAGRQASDEVMQNVPRERWPEAGLVVSFFWKYYPQKTDNLGDISPLLAEIGDSNQPEFWRWWLVRVLTVEWNQEGRLTNEQRQQVSEALMRLSQQPAAPASILAEATRGIPRLLASMKKALPALTEGEGPAEPHRRLAAVSREYAQAAAALLTQKGTPGEVQHEAIAGLVRLHEMSLAGSEVAAKAVANSARDYASHPEDVWAQLMLAASRLTTVTDLGSLVEEAEKAAKEPQTVERLRTVAALAAAPARKSPSEKQPKYGIQRLSECTPEQLLAMAQSRADGLARNSLPERAWSELSAIFQEYEKRNRQAG